LQILIAFFQMMSKPFWCSFQGVKQVIQLEIYKFKNKSQDNE